MADYDVALYTQTHVQRKKKKGTLYASHDPLLLRGFFFLGKPRKRGFARLIVAFLNPHLTSQPVVCSYFVFFNSLEIYFKFKTVFFIWVLARSFKTDSVWII